VLTPGQEPQEDVVIDYTNWRGERAERLIHPDFIWFGESPFHPEPQWVLEAWDYEKQANRWFALKDIHSWKQAEGAPRFVTCAMCQKRMPLHAFQRDGCCEYLQPGEVTSC
jgi:predicted DNA-binding transcriptional regulator YafY